jgi:hypothetical protein
VIERPPKSVIGKQLLSAITPQSSNRAVPETSAATPSRPVNITTLSALEQLPQGQTLVAQVKSIHLLSSSEKVLLQQTNPSLIKTLATSQNASLQTTTQTTIQSNHLSGDIVNKMIAKDPLYLVKLLVQQPTAKALLLTTVTPQALTLNQTLLITKSTQQQISITQLQTNTLQYIATETIKQVLPKQQSISQLQQFIQQLNALPDTIKTRLLSPELRQPLQTLLNFTHTDKTLNQAPQIKQALTNSGVQLENKLSQLTNKTLQNPINNDIRSLLDKMNTALVSDTTRVDKPKLVVPEVEKLLNSLLPLIAQAATGSNNTPLLKALPTSTIALFQLLGMPPPQNPEQQLPLPKLIQYYLKQLIEQSQAKIQFNQLRSLGLDTSLSDSKNTLIQQFHTEIPLRFNEQILPLYISIQEHHKPNQQQQNETASSEEEKNKTRQHRWQVLMSFDLPDDEKLHTQLTIIDTSITATLWAESLSLCQKTQEQINILRDKLVAHGLHVEELNCIYGTPPQQDFTLGYNLVDIKT